MVVSLQELGGSLGMVKWGSQAVLPDVPCCTGGAEAQGSRRTCPRAPKLIRDKSPCVTSGLPQGRILTGGEGRGCQHPTLST